jgi:L-alanine-DL-glutamate epimerase-like enolase superfamily enzyme
LTYEECKVVRKKTNLPFILDECMDSIQSALRAWSENSVDIINLKISRLGGLSKSKLFKDICCSLGISLTIEDSWGSQITDATIAHLAHSTPADLHFQSSAFHEYTNIETARGAPTIEAGYMYCSNKPGLGVIPNYEVLGNPVLHLHDRS